MRIHTSDPSVVELANMAFAGYKGKKYVVNITDKPVGLKSCWDGGSRDYHKVMRLSTKEVVDVPENGSIFTKDVKNDKFPCPDFVVITHSIIQGKDYGITISIHPDNMNQLALPEPVKLTKDELIVLVSITKYKSSYAGVSNYRFVQAKASMGMTATEWGHATHSLIEKGFLNKRCAITNEGRNAITQYNVHDFYGVKELIRKGEI